MNKTLFVEKLGKGPALVLLHGWGWDSRIWEPLIPILSKNFRLYLIDLPGSGKSNLVSNDYALNEIISALLAITPKKAAWLGWSLGGMLAWYIAIHSPERVSQLITIASSPRFIANESWPGVALQTLEKFHVSLQKNYQQTLIDFLELQLRGSTKNSDLFTELKNKLPRTSVAALNGGLKLLNKINLCDDLDKIQCESLHVFGSHDTLVTTKVIDLIKPKMPFANFEIIQRAGHIPFITQREIFLELLNQFFFKR